MSWIYCQKCDINNELGENINTANTVQKYTSVHTNIKLNPTDLNWYRTKKYRASIKGFALVCWCLTALSAQIGYIVP